MTNIPDTTTTITTTAEPEHDPAAGPVRPDRTLPVGDPPDHRHDWEVAGEAWGHAVVDWATLFEHYSIEVVDEIAVRTAIGPGIRVLDVACGSGWATRRFAHRGATVAGIDAAARLVDYARHRLPEAEIVHGSMFDLPWEDASVDVVTSINGIWGGCEAAIDEAHRVLRPGGHLAISFWGIGEPLDLKPCFSAVAGHLDARHVSGMISTNGIARPGVAEDMLAASGFEIIERGRRLSILEWPDADTAWRALRSTGPVVPALRGADESVVRTDVLAAIDHCRTTFGTYRFENVHEFVIARSAG